MKRKEKMILFVHGRSNMSFRAGVALTVYIFIALTMCSFILLMNEDNEGLGSPSIMTPVRSSQKGSVLQKIIWSLIALFFLTCILLNRFQSRDATVTQVIAQQNKSNESKLDYTLEPANMATDITGDDSSTNMADSNPVNDITDDILSAL